MIIALDGFSGTGKSTLSKLIAEKLNFKCLNTGMIYRGITYYFIKNNIKPDNLDDINKIIDILNVEVFYKNNLQYIVVDNFDCTDYVSDIIVQNNVSKYSVIKSIRQKVHKIQIDISNMNDIVVEGRDIGTETFPNADYKFFITCDVKVRAERRYNDLIRANKTTTLVEVEKSIQERDFIDTTREISPLRKADDAIVIDTSKQTIEESLEEILSHIKI